MCSNSWSSSDWPPIHNPLPQPSDGITGVYHHAQSQQVTVDALSIKFIFPLLFQYTRGKMQNGLGILFGNENENQSVKRHHVCLLWHSL